ncbi:nuclear transport factor 2 family protein [Actinoallomurus spadix]|uniref:Nuclear transport factor 2 family protein n=1 Tax=Actinoallomurus spadix TaxID=79912 RepID=A0ABN0WUV3_9ACTN|nr:nuclear transport factor 2 family protein [Actinoallomurus spadix]MCO5986476.1 nuclear transport factor 2 family protein [Actinoallomurus spadix]
MSDVNELAGRYIDTWNEKDPAARRAAVEALWTADGTYVDPLADVAGHDGIDAVIGAVQAQFPDFVFRLGSAVDAHHDLARFTWELGPEGGEAIVVGFDVMVLAEDGRIRNVHGFLDKVPAGA